MPVFQAAGASPFKPGIFQQLQSMGVPQQILGTLATLRDERTQTEREEVRMKHEEKLFNKRAEQERIAAAKTALFSAIDKDPSSAIPIIKIAGGELIKTGNVDQSTIDELIQAKVGLRGEEDLDKALDLFARAAPGATPEMIMKALPKVAAAARSGNIQDFASALEGLGTPEISKMREMAGHLSEATGRSPKDTTEFISGYSEFEEKRRHNKAMESIAQQNASTDRMRTQLDVGTDINKETRAEHTFVAEQMRRHTGTHHGALMNFIPGVDLSDPTTQEAISAEGGPASFFSAALRAGRLSVNRHNIRVLLSNLERTGMQAASQLQVLAQRPGREALIGTTYVLPVRGDEKNVDRVTDLEEWRVVGFKEVPVLDPAGRKLGVRIEPDLVRRQLDVNPSKLAGLKGKEDEALLDIPVFPVEELPRGAGADTSGSSEPDPTNPPPLTSPSSSGSGTGSTTSPLIGPDDLIITDPVLDMGGPR